MLKKRMIDVNVSHLKNKCDAADTVEFLLTDCPKECYQFSFGVTQC